MEKTTFQGIECYIGYKGFSNDFIDYDNQKYKLNKWYKVLTNKYGNYILFVSQTKIQCLDSFPTAIYKCYIPVNQKITLFENDDYIICETFYISDETVEINEPEESNISKETQIELLCENNKNFKYWEYNLTNKQIKLLCVFNKNFKYWEYNLAEYHIVMLCIHNPNFKYWEYELDEYKINLLCQYNKNFAYWEYELTEKQINLLCMFNDNFKYWNYDLTEYQIDLLCTFNLKFKYWNYDLTEYQIDILRTYNPEFEYWGYDIAEHQIETLGKDSKTKPDLPANESTTDNLKFLLYDKYTEFN